MCEPINTIQSTGVSLKDSASQKNLAMTTAWLALIDAAQGSNLSLAIESKFLQREQVVQKSIVDLEEASQNKTLAWSDWHSWSLTEEGKSGLALQYCHDHGIETDDAYIGGTKDDGSWMLWYNVPGLGYVETDIPAPPAGSPLYFLYSNPPAGSNPDSYGLHPSWYTATEKPVDQTVMENMQMYNQHEAEVQNTLNSKEGMSRQNCSSIMGSITEFQNNTGSTISIAKALSEILSQLTQAVMRNR